jgi:hypothetical protein
MGEKAFMDLLVRDHLQVFSFLIVLQKLGVPPQGDHDLALTGRLEPSWAWAGE